MTITHHPSDETLAAFASGTLDEARSVVVAAHVSLCARCRGNVVALEQFGGVLIERASPAVLRADAIDAALLKIDAGEAEPIIPVPAVLDIPHVLAPYDVGPWKWIGRGLYWRTADVPSPDDTRVFMLKAAPEHGCRITVTPALNGRASSKVHSGTTMAATVRAISTKRTKASSTNRSWRKARPAFVLWRSRAVCDCRDGWGSCYSHLCVSETGSPIEGLRVHHPHPEF